MYRFSGLGTTPSLLDKAPYSRTLVVVPDVGDAAASIQCWDGATMQELPLWDRTEGTYEEER